MQNKNNKKSPKLARLSGHVNVGDGNLSRFSHCKFHLPSIEFAFAIIVKFYHYESKNSLRY